jgi:hypothetical protein
MTQGPLPHPKNTPRGGKAWILRFPQLKGPPVRNRQSGRPCSAPPRWSRGLEPEHRLTSPEETQR